MADPTAQWAAPGPSAPPTRPHRLGAGPPGVGGAEQVVAEVQPAAVQVAVAGQAQSQAQAQAQIQQIPGRAATGRRSGTRPIPLRPLSVLEVIDAGVGALRSIPRRVHLIAIATSVGVGLVGFALLVYVQHTVGGEISRGSYTTTDFFGNTTVFEGVASPATNFGRFLLDVLSAVVWSGLAVGIVAGLYATSVQRYIDGLPPDLATSRAGYRGRLVRLVGLALWASMPRFVFLGLTIALTLHSADDPGGSTGGTYAWLVLLGAVICFGCSANLGVSSPVLVLEHTRVFKSLRRSTRLARGGRWRAGWTSSFALLMTASPIILLLIFLVYARSEGSGDGAFGSMFSNLDILLTGLVIVLSVPLRAATATMLYVDRRFRREGLDVRIAWARIAKETL